MPNFWGHPIVQKLLRVALPWLWVKFKTGALALGLAVLTLVFDRLQDMICV